ALLEAFIPDAFRLDAVAEAYGRRLPPLEAEEDGEADEGENGSYPIHDGTRVVSATHAQLGRQGRSQVIRAAVEEAGPSRGAGGGGGGGPAFGLVVDEVGSFVNASRHELPLAHRVVARRDADGTGGTRLPVRDCPKSNRSGSCLNCRLHALGGVTFGARLRY